MNFTMFVIGLFLGLSAMARTSLSQEGPERLQSYILGKSSALGDYVCEQAISIGSDPKAPVLMAANARISLAYIDGYGYEKFESASELLDGQWKMTEYKINGLVGYIGSERPVLTEEGWEAFRFDGTLYCMHKGVLNPGSDSDMKHGLGGTSSSPFMEWPAMMYSFLRSRQVLNLPKAPVEMLKEMTCVWSKSQGDKLVSMFVLGDPKKGTRLGARVTFDDDMIVRTEWLLVSPGREETFADVATKWDKTMSDPLPTRVHAHMHAGNPEVGFMDYIVDFKWHFPGDQEFDRVKAIIEPVRAMPKTKRSIAGTEQPQAAEKPKK